MSPNFKHSEVSSLPGWTNYSGSIGKHAVPIFCTIKGDGLKQHADAVREILRHCFDQAEPPRLRTIGSTWSFSKVLEPGQVMIDPGNMFRVEDMQAHVTDEYAARRPGYRPVFVEGGTGIGTLNDALGGGGLSLQTSGAGNGHRIAGCIATGTHGSALRIGALHDTVLAVYLIVSPDRALFVQSGSKPAFKPSAAEWLEKQTGIPTLYVANDNAIQTARVSLGSLGFVFGVVVEAAPLYRLQIKRSSFLAEDPKVLHAIRTLDTSTLHPMVPDKPYHFDIVMHPYPSKGKPGWFVTFMWKRRAHGFPYAAPLQGIPRTTVDTMGLIASLTDALGDGLPGALTFDVVRSQIQSQLAADARPENDELFAGQVFGPTTLPAGRGASTEIVVKHADVIATLATVREVLDSERREGNLLLGCVALRFVPRTRSLLGMNHFDMNCFIELPSIRSDGVLSIYRALWAALEKKGINFTCHWGQMGGLTPARVRRYFGPAAAKWSAQRSEFLGSDAAKHVFASGILSDAGL